MLDNKVKKKINSLVIGSNKSTKLLCDYLATLESQLNPAQFKELKRYMVKHHKFSSARFNACIRVGHGEIPVECLNSKIPDFVAARADSKFVCNYVNNPKSTISVINIEKPHDPPQRKNIVNLTTNEITMVMSKGHGKPATIKEQREYAARRNKETAYRNVFKANKMRIVGDEIHIRDPHDKNRWIACLITDVEKILRSHMVGV